MTLDVTWDGVALAKGAQAREQDGGWFVELEQPMPVGTLLQLAGDTQGTVRVARVHEGLGAGMLVTKIDSPQSSVESKKAEGGKAEGGKPEEQKAEGAKAESGQVDGGKPEGGDKLEKPEAEESGKSRRRRNRKTDPGVPKG